MSDTANEVGASSSPTVDSTVPGRASTREVAAGAALGFIGAFGVFFPVAGVALTGALVTSGTGPGGVLGAVAWFATNVPAVSLLALAAVVAVYQGSRLARRLGLVVASLLVAGLPVWILATFSRTMGDSGPVQVALWHLFLVAPFQPLSAAVGAGAGFIVAWGLLSHAGPSRARIPARRPSVAMFLLIVIGVESVVPYLSWLATNVLVPTASANGGPVHGAGADPTAGLFVALGSAIASTSALAAARAIRSRAPYGPYLAPAASAMAGPWSALWVVLMGVGIFGSVDEGSTVDPVRLVAQAAVIILAGVSALAFFVVTGGVLLRRDWFLDRPATKRPPGSRIRSRPGRFWTATAGIWVASLVPLTVALAMSMVNPPPTPLPLYYTDVLFDGRAYRHAAPLEIDESALMPAGSLSAWTADLEISETRPDAFSLPGIPIELAIVVRGGVVGSALSFSVFVPAERAGAVPAEVCRYVPIESPGVLVGPCVPMTVSLAGSTYDVVGDGGYVVVAGDLDPSGTNVEAGAVDPRVDLAANLVRGVPASEAIALRAGDRILLFVASGRPIGGELCRYSPAAMANPLAEEKPEVGDAPQGCLFPPNVIFDDRTYQREEVYGDLVRIPTTALTPLGIASALHPDFERIEPGAALPFPSTVDPTAHGIAGVDPATAIAFRAGDRVVLAVRRSDGESLAIPPALCAYVDPDAAAQWERDNGKPVGCALP